MGQISHRTHVGELISIMWYEEEQMLVRVWQHDDNYIEIYPYFQKSWKLPWSANVDLMGFLKRLREGVIRPLTKEEETLFFLLRE